MLKGRAMGPSSPPPSESMKSMVSSAQIPKYAPDLGFSYFLFLKILLWIT